VTRHTSDKVVTYAVLVAVALVAAVALGQPGLAGLGAPFAVALVAGLTTGRRAPPEIAVAVSVTPHEILEGERAEIRLEIRSGDVDGRCDVGLALPAGLAMIEGEPAQAVSLRAGGAAELVLVAEARRWGSYRVGPAAVRLREPGGMHVWEGRAGEAAGLRVRPLRSATRAVVRPFTAGAGAGEHTSHVRAEGIELADLRPYVPGDRAARINWRATARRGSLVVSERHPDRNTDVVLFIDTFSERGLADTVRIASTLADVYLRRHDRVGLVSFGGVLSWVEPGGGARQRERLDEALLGVESYTSFAWKSLARVPARTLPPRGLVLAVSPLVDERTLAALGSLALRRIDLAVVEVPLETGPELGSTWSGAVTLRLQAMQHQVVRDRFLAMGVAVVPWRAAAGIEVAVREIDEYRRHARVRVRR
jgi:uncharacterized protein (DUF58 family)